MASTPSYTVDYEDEKFQQVEADKQQALTDVKDTYGGMIENSDQYYNDLINQSKEYADKQAQLQQENTDFALEKIEQQREQAQKDYTKEQSGAYVDWQKQSNQYGANAEMMAQQGLTGSGYSESSQVAMYTAYQNRVATAREVMAQANQNFDNNIQQAILQNNSALAEIYANANREQLEIALQGFQYKNSLLESQLQAIQETEDRYYSRYQDVLEQINHENAMTEQIRQYEQSYALQVKEYEEGIRQFNEEIKRLKAKDKQEYELEIKKLEQAKKELEEQKRQANLSYQARMAEIAESKRQFDIENESAKISQNNEATINGVKATKTGLNTKQLHQFQALLNIPSNADVYYANGTYYAKTGSDYVDITKILEQTARNMGTTLEKLTGK